MSVVEINHPLVKHKIGLMREASISTKKFRELTLEVARLLAYEATHDFALGEASVEGWAGPVAVQRLDGRKLTVVPILRAGLGMLDAVLEMVPAATVSVVGMARDEQTLRPRPYFERLADHLAECHALVVDPMLATGGSMVAACDLLKRNGCTRIKALVLVAAPEGIAAMTRAHPDVEVFAAAIDSHLDERGYILPGLGDAGDRIFGTRPAAEPAR